MGGRDWAQELAARTNTLETRNPIVVERFNFAMDFLFSELKRHKGRPKAAAVYTQNV
jgi:hypothetical protein